MESLGRILARPGYAFTDEGLLGSLRASHGLLAVAEAVKLSLTAELASRPAVNTGVRAGLNAAGFLAEGLNQSRAQARRDLDAAVCLHDGPGTAAVLPVLGQALASGQISRAHLDVAVSTLRRIPRVLKARPLKDPGTGATQTGAEVIDEVLAEQSRVFPPSTIDRLGQQIVQRLDPARAGRGFNADDYERRDCSISTDGLGMGRYLLYLDQATTHLVSAAIAAHSAPRPTRQATTSDGQLTDIRDERTGGQRRADAMATLILTGATHLTTTSSTSTGTSSDDGTGTGAGTSSDDSDGTSSDGDGGQGGAEDEPAGAGAGIPAGAAGVAVSVCVIATLDQVAAAYGATDPGTRSAGAARVTLAGVTTPYPGTTLHPHALARLTCNSTIHRIITDDRGVVLHHGRARRLATVHQKRVLAIRDGGCVIPGCDIPPEWCDVHHLNPWEQGGKTDLDNLALLCGQHHTAHHAGIYDLRIKDGITWTRMPSWRHPGRPWLHNPAHHHRLADHLTTTLTTGILTPTASPTADTAADTGPSPHPRPTTHQNPHEDPGPWP